MAIGDGMHFERPILRCQRWREGVGSWRPAAEHLEARRYGVDVVEGDRVAREFGPAYETGRPSGGCDSTHVARSRAKWNRRRARANRRNGGEGGYHGGRPFAATAPIEEEQVPSIATPTAWCARTARTLERGTPTEQALLLAALALHADGYQDREVRRTAVDALPDPAARPAAWLAMSALLKLEA